MAILNTNTSESNARLISIEGQPQDAGFVIRRTWPWLQAAGLASNDTHINSLYKTIAAVTSVTNPKANNDSYAGKFMASLATAKDESEDGDGSRASTIVQVLAKVKVVLAGSGTGDVATLGTPDKGADKETLNYLGFQEGTQEHIYHKYRNLDSATKDLAMGKVPTETGYTIVKRKFDIESDKTATLYVVFEKDTWTAKAWLTDRKLVSYINYDTRSNLHNETNGKTGGKGYEEEFQLTGLSNQTDGYPRAVTKAQKGDTHRVVQNVTLVERGDGEYKVTQKQGVSFAGTSASTAEIIMIKSDLNGGQQAGMIRQWPRRTLAAKNTLLAGEAVAAVSPYLHDSVRVDDNGDGTFDVTQTLSSTDGEAGTAQTYFNETHYQVVKMFVRTTDDTKKFAVYQKYMKCFSSHQHGNEYIGGLVVAKRSSDTRIYLLKGSDSVTKKAPFYFVAQAVLGSSATLTWPLASTGSMGVTDWE